MAKRKTWREKLDDGRTPKVERLEKPYAGFAAGALMLISTPREVQAFVKKIPPGTSLAPAEIRRQLAQRHHAEVTCPLSFGIFLRIAAEAAWEEIEAGQDPGAVTPFWRAVEPGSPLAGKLTCGPAFLTKMRRAESIS